MFGKRGMRINQLLMAALVALLPMGVNAQSAEASVAVNSEQAAAETNGVTDINKFSAPEQAVWDTTQILVKIIDEERARFKEDPEGFYQRVIDALAPVVGFKRIAAMVMGSYYKKASKDQRSKFSSSFERSLVETYSGGLIEYDGYTIEVMPGEEVPAGKRTAVVDVRITTSSGSQIPLKYSMYKTKKGQWKVQNVTVAGINVGLLYRQQFARKVAEAKGDLELVVNQWSSKLDVEVEDGQIKTSASQTTAN